MNKIITVKSTEMGTVKAGDNEGNQYLKVHSSDGKTYSIFEEGLWNTLQVGSAVQLTLEKNQKGYWGVTDAKSVAQELAAKAEEPPKSQPAPQELGMWWKEAGEMIRTGYIKKDTDVGGVVYRAYFAKMLDVLGIKVEKKEES